MEIPDRPAWQIITFDTETGEPIEPKQDSRVAKKAEAARKSKALQRRAARDAIALLRSERFDSMSCCAIAEAWGRMLSLIGDDRDATGDCCVAHADAVMFRRILLLADG